MKGLKITNKTGCVFDTKVFIDGIEIENCINSIEIFHSAGSIPMAKLTMMVSEIDMMCKVEVINKLEFNKHGLSRIN